MTLVSTVSEATTVLSTNVGVVNDVRSTAHLRRVLTLATRCRKRLRQQGNVTSVELDRFCKELRQAYRERRKTERRQLDCNSN